jgi:hypothetical protein
MRRVAGASQDDLQRSNDLRLVVDDEDPLLAGCLRQR